jgi:peptidoglycan/LPS O-acetylase OafA/YrhL
LPRARLFALDHLKALAIVAVVFTHAGSGAWIREGIDLVLTRLWTPFHVPSFLFTSGFLYAAREPIRARAVGRRLRRILVPYLLASGVAIAVGVAEPVLADAGDVAFALATGSTLGVYYYIFLFCLCLPLLWPLSRAPVTAIALLWAACVALTVLQEIEPRRWAATSIFWAMRNPFEHFALGYFLSGWLASLYAERIAALHASWPRALFWLCCAGAVIGAIGNPTILRFGREWPRILYSFSVIGLVAQLAGRRAPGGAVRFLSEATLGLYLYHYILQLAADPWSAGWPPALRILAQVAIGLGGATLLLLAARQLLGRERARVLVGA